MKKPALRSPELRHLPPRRLSSSSLILQNRTPPTCTSHPSAELQPPPPTHNIYIAASSACFLSPPPISTDYRTAPPHYLHLIMIYNSSSNRCSRQRRHLTICAITLAILEEEQAELDITHRGRLLGAKHIKRTRKSIEEMFRELGLRAARAFKSSMDELSRLHSILEPYLLDQFGSFFFLRPLLSNVQ